MADCSTEFSIYDPACNGQASTPAPTSSSSGSGTGDAQSWIGALGGLFGTIYKDVNPVSPVVAGRGIPGSPSSLRPAQQTGIGTLLVIAVVAVLVWFGVRRRR